MARSHQIVIIGGGAAGISTAASLLRRNPDLDIAIVEPSTVHYYQPGFTLVGAGTDSLERMTRSEARYIPEGATWIQEAASGVRPGDNRVDLASGEELAYEHLVACPGVVLDWQRIEGLPDTLGTNGVCSNYAPETAPYTWQCVQDFTGGRAIFTQPPMPIKCPGAPQKAAYLAADYFRRHGVDAEVEFDLAAGKIFGVDFYVPALERVAESHGIQVNYQDHLVAVDGANRQATFEAVGEGEEPERVTRTFDLLHVTPPQSPPDWVKQSPLANENGYIEVDPTTLQHTRFDNVFALGDAGSTPNSKTAAAVRLQAPVVAGNLLARLEGRPFPGAYDGYASCPLTTRYGKVLNAEFTYGGKPVSTLPLEPRKERRLMWWINRHGLPMLYWNVMLSGREWLSGHRPRA